MLFLAFAMMALIVPIAAFRLSLAGTILLGTVTLAGAWSMYSRENQDPAAFSGSPPAGVSPWDNALPQVHSPGPLPATWMRAG